MNSGLHVFRMRGFAVMELIVPSFVRKDLVGLCTLMTLAVRLVIISSDSFLIDKRSKTVSQIQSRGFDLEDLPEPIGCD